MAVRRQAISGFNAAPTGQTLRAGGSGEGSRLEEAKEVGADCVFAPSGLLPKICCSGTDGVTYPGPDCLASCTAVETTSTNLQGLTPLTKRPCSNLEGHFIWEKENYALSRGRFAQETCHV